MLTEEQKKRKSESRKAYCKTHPEFMQHLKKIGFGKSDPRRDEGRKFYKGHKINVSKKYKPWNEQSKKNLSKAKMGLLLREKSPAWRGNKQIRKIIARMPEYFGWRTKIFLRDNFTCCDCHQRGGILHVHHLFPVREIIKKYNIKILEDARSCKELWDLNNGITLCAECHKRTDSYLKYTGKNKNVLKIDGEN